MLIIPRALLQVWGIYLVLMSHFHPCLYSWLQRNNNEVITYKNVTWILFLSIWPCVLHLKRKKQESLDVGKIEVKHYTALHRKNCIKIRKSMRNGDDHSKATCSKDISKSLLFSLVSSENIRTSTLNADTHSLKMTTDVQIYIFFFYISQIS